MSNKEFMQESMDLKRFALCLKKQLRVFLLITVCGAVLSGGIYMLYRCLFMETRWQARSQFYLQFVYNASEALQSYNGYTWNDLIHADPVIDLIIDEISQSDEGEWDTLYPGSDGGNWDSLNQGITGPESRESYFREMVREALEGEILSDVRLLTITTTTDDSKKTTMIQEVAEKALLRYVEGQSEIISVEQILSADPVLVVWDDRSTQAVIGGGIFFFVVSLFAWCFAYILDDSLYVIADGEKRYPFPVLGLLVKSINGEGIQPYAGEMAENVSYLLKDVQKLAFFSVESMIYHTKESSNREITGKELVNKENKMVQVKAVFDKIIKEKVSDQEWETIVLDSYMPGSGLGAALRDMDGVILAVPFGRRNGKATERTISFLRNQDCKIQGILIVDGDERFWKSYF